MNLEGKTALVTGGVSGIGRATVMKFAKSGAAVICLDVNAEKGAELMRDAAATNFVLEFDAVDLADVRAVRRCVLDILKRYPRIDILVNAAGWGDIQPFVENQPDYMDRVITVNLNGMLHLTQALLPAIIASGHGKIINVASDAGRVGSSGETAYAAAKGGVIAFTKSLARELARHSVNVNCVCPGPTDTPMLASRPEKMKEALLRAIPFRRFAKPQEIADAIVFFASPRSDYITGQVLSVSGGLTFAG